MDPEINFCALIYSEIIISIDEIKYEKNIST